MISPEKMKMVHDGKMMLSRQPLTANYVGKELTDLSHLLLLGHFQLNKLSLQGTAQKF